MAKPPAKKAPAPKARKKAAEKTSRKTPRKTTAPKPAAGPKGGGARYVAFLRSINIGGRTLPMPTLASLFEKAGCTNVKTYIQSGNVVFTRAGSVEGVATTVEQLIVEAAGFEAPVVIRSERELEALLDGAPFPDPAGEKPALHALFLKDVPTPEAVRALDPNRSPGDRFEVRGATVYLLCPKGLADTKLTNAYFDSKLRTTSTGRNFRTIQKMLEMCRE